MEKVFDLREFLLMIYTKSKNSLTLLVTLGIMGAIWGGITTESNVYISQASSSVNLISQSANETDSIDIIMGNIRETVTGNYFYISILNEIGNYHTENEMKELFDTHEAPNLNDLRQVLNIYTSGNNVIIEVKADNSVTAQKFGNTIRDITVNKLALNIQNIVITVQQQYVYNQMLETGDIIGSRILKYSVAGVLAGFAVTMCYSYFFSVINTKVNTAADLQKYNLPILGEITEGDELDG